MRDYRVIPIRRLIDDVVIHGRRHWRQILPSVALVHFGIGLLTLLLQEKQLELANNPDPSPDTMLELFAVLVPVLFVVLAAYMVAFNAVMVACMDALEEGSVNMGRAWGFSLRPQVFLTNGVVWFFAMLSMACCFIPVLFVGPRLAHTLPVMVHRGIFGFKAMGASVQLSKYNPTGRWREGTFIHTLGVLVAGALIYYAVNMVVQLPLVIMQSVMAFRQAASGDLSVAPVPPMWMQVPTYGLVAVATTAAWIYWCFGLAALYREVLRRKKGRDLQEAIDQMTARPVPVGTSGPTSTPEASDALPADPPPFFPQARTDLPQAPPVPPEVSIPPEPSAPPAPSSEDPSESTDLADDTSGSNGS